MNGSWPPELIVVARANFVEDETGRRFQNLDGAYLDSLAPWFQRVYLVAVVFRKGCDPQYDRLQNYSYRFRSPNIEVVEIPESDHLRQLRVITRLLRGHPTALSYVFFPTMRAVFAALTCRLRSRPYFVYSGGLWDELIRLAGGSSLKARFCGRLESWSYRGATVRLFTPAILLQRYRSCGITERARPITTIDVLPQFESRPLSRPVRILCVAAILPLKGHDTLVEAAALLHRRHIPVTLDLVGGIHEDWKRQLDRLVAQRNLDGHVRFHGWIADRQQLAQHYRQADLFVLPSRSEGFPRVLLEAMGFGLPVISTNIPNIAGVVDDRVTAWLVPPDNPEALADAIATVIADPAVRHRLAEQGWRWVRDQLHETPADQFRRLMTAAGFGDPPR